MIESQPTTKEEMIELQNKYRPMLNHSNKVEHARYIAGADLTVEDDLMVGCFAVIDAENECKPVYTNCKTFDVKVPYVPGLLCFREGPVVMSLLRDFQAERPDISIDLLIVDGCGEWHPRGFGLACYVGLLSGVPTIGVSKSYLYVGNEMHSKEVQHEAQSHCPSKYDHWVLEHTLEDGFHIRCGVLRTTDSSPFNPIYVSCGHLCDLESALTIVKGICLFREPEPVRLADRISRQYVRETLHPQKKK